MSGLKLAIWDVDGTLVDSRTSIHEIMVEAFTLSALTPPEYDATRRIVGLSLHEACGQLAPDANAAEIDRLVNDYRESWVRARARPDFTQPLYDGALETLEAAMQKIDTETKALFRDTFDRVNTVFVDRFPKLFGGGEAYLELTGDDLLDTGVRVMARPPGKRNSTIQLLSGGEKAMTAVALLLALFQLNPAPFCLMDEVDAPLDDANVGRFCDVVREMSEAVQFIIITHNKITMELAAHLHGVTMQEPGVSRLVSVDVQQAVALTEDREAVA